MFIRDFKKNNYSIIFTDIFQISLITYLLILIVEKFLIGFVSNFFNPQWFLWLVLFFGFLMVIFNKDHRQLQKNENNHLVKYDLIFIFVISLIIGLLVFFNTRDLHWISYCLGFCAFAVIWSTSFLIINDQN